MLKRLALAGLFSLALVSAHAQDTAVAPNQISNLSSGNVAAAVAAVTFPAAPGYLNRLCGFQFTSAGSTGAAVVNPTITGLKGGTATFTYATIAGATLTNQPLVVQFVPCVPASAQNIAIVVSFPSLGTGNTNATLVAQGYATAWP